MNKLEKIVPPLELCKLIPAGKFADSVFIWGYSCDKSNTEPFVDERDRVEYCRKNMVNAPPVFPAPTLHEIMAELSLCDVYCDTGWFCMVGAPDHWSIGNCECDLYVRNGTENKSPEAAALKLWLKLKGIKYAK